MQSWRRQSSSHSCAVEHGHCRCHARRCATTAALVQTSENCAGPAVAVLLRGRCPCCAGSSWRPVLDKVVDMPVIVNDSVLHSGGASNSVHRLFSWTFQLCNTDGYDASSILGYGGDEGIFDAFCVIFRAPPVVPELSASFRSPRWPTVVGHRGLLHNETVATCWH